MIAEKLGLNVQSDKSYAAFVCKVNYCHEQSESGCKDEQKPEADQAGNRDTGAAKLDERRGWSDRVRSKASTLIRDSIATAKFGVEPSKAVGL